MAKKFRSWLLKREGKRLPFSSPPLRMAGQGAGEEYSDALVEFACGVGAVWAAGVMFLVFWVRGCWGEPGLAWLVTGATYFMVWLLMSLGVGLWMKRVRRRVGDYWVGWLAEQVVGEVLEKCRKDLPYVFHDIIERKNGLTFNIDHVAIGEGGVFVFETKCKRKPLPVNPVLVYPGWNVKFEDFRNAGFNVSMEKNLTNFVATRPKILTPEEVNELGTLFDGSLRKERSHVVDVEA